MRSATSIGVFALVAVIVLAEFLGAGASLASVAHPDLEECFGYEICK